MSIWKRKPLAVILEEANESGKGLKRTLVLGLVIYFGYSRKRSALNRGGIAATRSRE